MTINSWGSEDPAEVAKGGTGNSTLTDHGILLGSGTSPVTPTAAPTNGQLIIGSTGIDPVLALPTGDTNEIAIGTGAGTLSIGIADDPVLPGNESVTIPLGTTAQEPAAVDGMLRYDSDTDMLRAVINGVWIDVSTGGGGGGAWVFLQETVASAAASVEWDNTYITSTYDWYVITYSNTYVTTGTVKLQLRVSNDNGSTFHTTGYSSSTGTLKTTYMLLSNAVTADSTDFQGSGVYFVNNPLSASIRTAHVGTWSEITTGIVASSGTYTALYDTAEANDALQITTSASTVNGTFRLYGLIGS